MDVQKISQAGVSVAQAVTGKVVLPTATAGLRPGAAPRLLMLAAGMVFCGLMMTAGLALGVVALLTQNPNSQEFWGWMGSAFGCFFGGGGGLIGAWNSYRQLEGAGDLWHQPIWTWLDWIIAGYGAMGVVFLVAAVIVYQRLSGTLDVNGLQYPTTYGLSLLGGIVTFQAALFLAHRALLRRAARQALESPAGN